MTPLVRLAVTGHRDLKEAHEPAIRESVNLVLKEIVAWRDEHHPDTAPSVRILSELAEGADRIVAQEALALRPLHNVTLECPLPAPREVYELDFKTTASRETFRNLLAHASAVFELDGQRAPKNNGEYLRSSDYADAGHLCVAHCDILIAIWDGKTGERGGTGHTVAHAVHRETTVIRIDSENPRHITVCESHDHWEPEWEAAIHRLLVQRIASPKGAEHWVRHYTGETLAPTDSEDRRPDILASRYGARYRASYRIKYLLSALAVTFAVLGLLPEIPESLKWVWPTLELVSIAGILLCFTLARRGKWHDRWLDYRLLAEQFRVLEFLHPLGETVPVFNPPKYWGVPSPRHSCVRWYFRARLHQAGLPNLRVTRDYIAQQRRHILAVTQGQLDYNEGRHKSAQRNHVMVEVGGVVLFVVTAVACMLHLGGWLLPEYVLGAVTAALPAFGAAAEGLLAQAEDKRIAGNTAAMKQHMEEVKARILALPEEASLDRVSAVAWELATEMTRETSGWHNLIHAQSPRM
jgi:hypothetical protein